VAALDTHEQVKAVALLKELQQQRAGGGHVVETQNPASQPDPCASIIVPAHLLFPSLPMDDLGAVVPGATAADILHATPRARR
jgi:hypothetical protein